MAIDVSKSKRGGGINPIGLIAGALTGGAAGGLAGAAKGAAVGAVTGSDSPVGRAMAMKSRLQDLGAVVDPPEAPAAPAAPVPGAPSLGVNTDLGSQFGAMKRRLGY